MLRQTCLQLKNPYVFKHDNSSFTTQLKHLLSKKIVHKRRWESLGLFKAKPLAHADVYVDHFTYDVKHDPHRRNNTFWVPDQRYGKIPVPSDYKDAYWWRDLESRRLQAPSEWKKHDIYSPHRRAFTDFSNLAFEKKFKYSKSQVLLNMKRDLR